MTGGTRAFVTGIGGQDGGYLAEQLLTEGVEVHALAHDAEPPPDVPGVELHLGDVTRTDDVRRLVLDLAPDEIYNLAAVSSVARSWEEPDLTAAVNGAAAVGVLDAAYRLQERSGREVRVLQASSAEIFGRPDRSPQDESTPIRPVNPYGGAKAYGHLMCGVYRHRGLHAATAILYNHESPRRPPQFVSRKITATVAAIARGEADRLVLGNLDARRDWGWAPDYVDAMVRAVRADRPGDFVVATGTGHSVREFAAAAFSRAGIDDWEEYVEVDPDLVRPVDATELVGDATKAHRDLGWSPTVTFEEVVARMVDAELERAQSRSRSR
jgi:GDPmannose 4,6-dehydratase